jgi:hypothetical protein
MKAAGKSAGRRRSRQVVECALMTALGAVLLAGCALDKPPAAAPSSMSADAPATLSATLLPPGGALRSTTAAASTSTATVRTTAPRPTTLPRATSSIATTSTTIGLPARLPADGIPVQVPILMYHYVDSSPPPDGPYADGLTVRTGDFEAELEFVSHLDLRTVAADRLGQELAASRLTIMREIGEPSYVLCYPCGAYDAMVEAAAREAGYVMAVGTDSGADGDPARVFELRRLRVPAFLPLAGFAALLD